MKDFVKMYNYYVKLTAWYLFKTVLAKSSRGLKISFLLAVVILICVSIIWFFLGIKNGFWFWYLGLLMFAGSLWFANKVKHKCFVYVYGELNKLYQMELLYGSK